MPSARALPLALLLLVSAEPEDGNRVSMRERPAKETVAPSRSNALHLNAHTFHGNVIQAPTESHVEHWIVSFCPNWWEPCQSMAVAFDQLGVEWERKLNTELLTKTVRFAAVDCATDKVLCNQQGVEQYPTVHHYHGGKRVSTWTGGNRKAVAEQLAKFLRRRLGDSDPASTGSGTGAGGAAEKAASGDFLPGDRTLDALLVLGVLSLNTWGVFSNPRLWQQSAAKAPEESISRTAPASTSTSKAAAAPSCPDTGREATGRVSRILPEDWKGASSSMEL